MCVGFLYTLRVWRPSGSFKTAVTRKTSLKPFLVSKVKRKGGCWVFRLCETLSVIKKVQSVIYVAFPIEILHVWVGNKSGNWTPHIRHLLFVRIWGALYWTWAKEDKIQEANNLRICWRHVGWGWLGAEAGVVFSLCFSFVCTEASIGKTLHRKTP